MRVITVRDQQDLERYVDFPREVYAGNLNWVPEDRDLQLSEIAGSTASASHCRIQPFLAGEDGRVLATVTAVVDDAFNAHWQEPAGHLFHFEALPDAGDAAAGALDAACAWLKAAGCAFARQSFLYGWQLPLTIDAYDVRPTFLHTFNPPYYHRFIKNAGFAAEKGAVEYQVRFDDALAARYRGFLEQAQGRGFRLRPWDFSRLEDETALFVTLYNRAFFRHWGAPQFRLAEMAALTMGLKDHLPPDICVFAERDGEPAGVVFSLPDLHQPMTGLPLDHGLLLCIAVEERYRGQGLNLAMAARSYLAMMARGYRSASYTIVLDDNWTSRRTAEKLGCHAARNYLVYRRDLGSGSDLRP